MLDIILRVTLWRKGNVICSVWRLVIFMYDIIAPLEKSENVDIVSND